MYRLDMCLKDLVDVINKCRERAQTFAEDLRKNEALTRYVLIDPILRALGWDTEDPSQIVPEFSTESGVPDYALFHEGKNYVVIEAKALGQNLDTARKKTIEYCWTRGVPYYTVTNGIKWEIYDVFSADPQKRKIVSVDLLDQPVGAVVKGLLALWRPGLPDIAAAQESVFTVKELSSRPKKSRGTEINLSQLERKLASGEIPRGTSAPEYVRFPNGETANLKYWRDLLVATVRWCEKRLQNLLPIQWPSTGKVIVSSDSSQMRAPKEVGQFFVETHDSALYLVKHACYVLSQIGVDPETVCVKLGSS